MLALARARAAQLGKRKIHLEAMDAEHLAYPDNSFDCVVLPYVLSVTPDPAALVREARRVCRQDGAIIIVNHFSGSGTWYLLEKMFGGLAARIGFRSEFSYQNHVLQHDWTVEKMHTVNLFGLSKLVRQLTGFLVRELLTWYTLPLGFLSYYVLARHTPGSAVAEHPLAPKRM